MSGNRFIQSGTCRRSLHRSSFCPSDSGCHCIHNNTVFCSNIYIFLVLILSRCNFTIFYSSCNRLLSDIGMSNCRSNSGCLPSIDISGNGIQYFFIFSSYIDRIYSIKLRITDQSFCFIRTAIDRYHSSDSNLLNTCSDSGRNICNMRIIQSLCIDFCILSTKRIYLCFRNQSRGFIMKSIIRKSSSYCSRKRTGNGSSNIHSKNGIICSHIQGIGRNSSFIDLCNGFIR